MGISPEKEGMTNCFSPGMDYSSWLVTVLLLYLLVPNSITVCTEFTVKKYCVLVCSRKKTFSSIFFFCTRKSMKKVCVLLWFFIRCRLLYLNWLSNLMVKRERKAFFKISFKKEKFSIKSLLFYWILICERKSIYSANGHSHLLPLKISTNGIGME